MQTDLSAHINYKINYNELKKNSRKGTRVYYLIFGHNFLHTGTLLGYKCKLLVKDVDYDVLARTSGIR